MFYWVIKAVLTPFLRTFWRPWVEGLEYVPEKGPAILASNHLSFLDSFFLPLVIPRRVTFLAKSDYFTEPGVKGWLKKLFFSGAGQVPIDRTGGVKSEAALRTGTRVLRQGRLLGIYPEGTRSPDGRLYRGKIGVAKMALDAQIPVIPVAMIGTFEIQPQGRHVPKLGRIGIRIGRPLDFQRYVGMSEDRFVLRSMTDEIMYGLMALSGQEYVDIYAQRAKADLGAARAAAAEAARAAAEPAGGQSAGGQSTDGQPSDGASADGASVGGSASSGPVRAGPDDGPGAGPGGVPGEPSAGRWAARARLSRIIRARRSDRNAPPA